jgi:DNA-binding SARP family transcriptional activator
VQYPANVSLQLAAFFQVVNAEEVKQTQFQNMKTNIVLTATKTPPALQSVLQEKDSLSETSTPLRVHLFGHFSVERGGYRLAGLEARRLQEVFSYLLLHRHRLCSREILATLFWPESSTEQSKRNLRQVLWQLQAALQTEQATNAECILQVTADWLQINPNANIWLDVAFFEQAYNDTKHIAGRDLDTTQVQLLREATAFHSEILLCNNYEDWCLRERQRLLRLCITMLEKLMEYSITHHDYDAALRYGSRILDYDHICETAHQQLMRLYYFLGKRIEALKQYRQYETALLEELGAAPSKSTRDLYQYIFLDQCGSETDPEATHKNVLEYSSLLAHFMHDFQQIQQIQNQAQAQIDFRIQKIEQRLHTFVEASEKHKHKLTPSEVDIVQTPDKKQKAE